MIGIVGTRGSGKTTALVKASAAMKVPIYCHKESQVRFIENAAFRAGVRIPPPISGEWRGMLASDRQRIAIDDAGLLLNRATGCDVVIAVFDAKSFDFSRMSLLDLLAAWFRSRRVKEVSCLKEPVCKKIEGLEPLKWEEADHD